MVVCIETGSQILAVRLIVLELICASYGEFGGREPRVVHVNPNCLSLHFLDSSHCITNI